MPSITDLKNTKKTNKLFKKKEYRPWDDPNINETKTQNTVTILQNQLVIEEKSNFSDLQLEKLWRYLYGAKRSVLQTILNNIEETHINYVITKSLTNEQLMLESSLPSNTIKTSIQQLKKENLILNYERKPGKGGFARYKIQKSVYKYFISKFSDNN